MWNVFFEAWNTSLFCLKSHRVVDFRISRADDPFKCENSEPKTTEFQLNLCVFLKLKFILVKCFPITGGDCRVSLIIIMPLSQVYLRTELV